VRQPVPFGKYLLLDRISVGGMAEVFKAKSYGVEGFEKIIAIKRILPTMGEDRDFIKMFIDEAKIAGQLAHANICQIFELGRIDGSHFIAMEYIWGKDLLQIQNRLRKLKQPMPVPMACFAIAKVLEGLDYAHRKRDPLGRPLEIVHRDCSPQNVLVSYEGEVKIIDFGIAKATSRNSRTMAGVLKGKFGYMSPEQVRGLPLDRRSDVFALGTMLYECLTGERLFQGETDFSTLEKVRNVDIRPPRELNPAIPEVVEKVILKALARDVDDRYQWCSEMLADLQQYLMSQDVVFTAKSLSSWLKEVFHTEIERERQQLEHYKRVGRDGLIAGVPAAEAKLDVVENLGEAGPVEGDPTVLGGPSFDDIEQVVGAAAVPEVGPAPGSPAARGGAPLHSQAQAHDGDDGDFGEEAPTEIFGEIENQPALPMQPGAAPLARPGSASNGPASRPPRPPPGTRDSNPQPMAAASSGNTPRPQLSSTHGGGSGLAMQSYADRSSPLPPGIGYSGQQPMPPSPMPAGTPGPVPTPPNALVPPGQQNNQGKTLMGAAAPPGMPNYSGGVPAQPGYLGAPAMSPPQGYSAQYPSHPSNPGGYPATHPSGPMPAPMGPQSGPQMGTYPPPGYPSYPPNMMVPPPGYGPGYAPPGYAGPETVAPEPKKSSIVRDILIGVAIAALVLGGFLAVKFFILDAEEDTTTTTATQMATLRIQLPQGVSAKLFVDGKDMLSAVVDKNEVGVNAGKRKIRLVAKTGECEEELNLVAGKTTPMTCQVFAGTPPAPTPGSGSATTAPAPTPTPAPGSATPPTPAPPTAGSGSSAKPADAPKPADNRTPVAKPTPDKPQPRTPDKPKPPDKPDTGAGGLDAQIDKALDAKPKPADRPKPTPPPPSDDKGYLQLFNTNPAKIAVDGVDTGLTTPVTGKALPLAPGKHKVTFSVGADKYTFTVVIKAGGTETLKKEL
jgi:serine/threonine protein kinase